MFAPTFVIPDFDGERNPARSKAYLRILCDALTSLDMVYLRAHPATPTLYQSGVRYLRDRPDQEDWQTVPEVLFRGGADCKSLAAWRAAELRIRGIPAFCQFRWRGKEDRATFHIEVQYPDGRIEDPSKILGMGREHGF